jgi:hypothetical protein
MAAKASNSNDNMSDTKPVQVYILLGQSNMLGMGRVDGTAEGSLSLSYAVKKKKKYPYLMDEKGDWTVSDNVRHVRVMSSGTGPMKVWTNEWMTVQGCATIGPEMGIGHYVGQHQQVNKDDNNAQPPPPPVLILKSCIGNRSLGWDLLPPNSPPFDFESKGETWHYAGYRESPGKWIEGTEPEPFGWYAGKQYDGDIANVKKVLEDLNTYYPGHSSFEIAGFFWWQGDKDRNDAGHASRYEHNLVHLIRQLRKHFVAPHAKFVCATLGQTSKENDEGMDGQILRAQLAVDGTNDSKYSEFQGNVATVYSHPLCHGGASNDHYNKNAETFMDIGEAMGLAMVKMLQADEDDA